MFCHRPCSHYHISQRANAPFLEGTRVRCTIGPGSGPIELVSPVSLDARCCLREMPGFEEDQTQPSSLHLVQTEETTPWPSAGAGPLIPSLSRPV